jgi:hypothetical protein
MLQVGRPFDVYKFPAIEEEEHRFSRISGCIIAICVGILPFSINMVWRVYAGTHSKDGGYSIFEDGITDLALAGVVIAVSTFTNTYFSVKLLGWQSVSWRTFGALLFVTITSLFSFVAYLLSIHEYIPSELKDKAFLATLFLVLSCIIWSYIAHYCFLEDEFRSAREELRRLPDGTRLDVWI